MQLNQQLFEDSLQQYISEQYSKLCLLKSHVLFQQKQLDNQIVKTNFSYDVLKIDTDNYKTHLLITILLMQMLIKITTTLL